MRIATAILVLVFVVKLSMGAENEPVSKPDTSPPQDAPKAKVSEEERDQKKEKKIRLNGRIKMEPETKADGSKKTEQDFDGYLITRTGNVPFRAENEEILAALRERDAEVATLEGRLKDQEKWMLVIRFIEKPQPPSDVRNPRGL